MVEQVSTALVNNMSKQSTLQKLMMYLKGKAKADYIFYESSGQTAANILSG